MEFTDKKLKILELFGGIGACSKALERIGIDFEIADYVEIDKYAVASYNAINNTDFEPQDIRTWNKDIEVDLIMHGSPCQDFSIAGKQAGGDIGSGTRSSLMYETVRIVEKLKPKYVIWENVKNVLSKKHRGNFDNYISHLDKIGYNSYYQVLNDKDYGIPQNRERVFTVSIRKDIDKGFEFPKPIELKLRLKDMLENEVDEKYYLSNELINRISNIVKIRKYDEKNTKQTQVAFNLYEMGIKGVNRDTGEILNSNGCCKTIQTMQGGNRQPKILVEEDDIKQLQNMLEEYETIDDSEILKKGKMKYSIFEKFGIDKKCFRCGSQLLISDLPQYDYLCFECDENFYEFEVK